MCWENDIAQELVLLWGMSVFKSTLYILYDILFLADGILWKQPVHVLEEDCANIVLQFKCYSVLLKLVIILFI